MYGMKAVKQRLSDNASLRFPSVLYLLQETLMNNRTDTSTQSVQPIETASKVEKGDKARPSRMRALVRWLRGRPKARKANVQEYHPNRTLEQVVAQYASDDRPEPENKEAAR